jgi:hypothetical protein
VLKVVLKKSPKSINSTICCQLNRGENDKYNSSSIVGELYILVKKKLNSLCHWRGHNALYKTGLILKFLARSDV